MQPSGRDLESLQIMLEAARQVGVYMSGRTHEDYLASAMLQDAVERRIEIIGDAATRVTERFRTSHPEIPWRDVIGQRIILAHAYDRILKDSIWDTASNRVPELVTLLEALLPTAGV